MEIEKLPRQKVNIETGIYFLFDQEEIVYIGQAVHIMRRVQDHLKDKIFDSYAQVNCLRSELDEKEKYYIRLYQPKYNVLYKTLSEEHTEVLNTDYVENTCKLYKKVWSIHVDNQIHNMVMYETKQRFLRFKGYQGSINKDRFSGKYYGEVVVNKVKYFITYAGNNQYKLSKQN